MEIRAKISSWLYEHLPTHDTCMKCALGALAGCMGVYSIEEIDHLPGAAQAAVVASAALTGAACIHLVHRIIKPSSNQITITPNQFTIMVSSVVALFCGRILAISAGDLSDYLKGLAYSPPARREDLDALKEEFHQFRAANDCAALNLEKRVTAVEKHVTALETRVRCFRIR